MADNVRDGRHAATGLGRPLSDEVALGTYSHPVLSPHMTKSLRRLGALGALGSVAIVGCSSGAPTATPSSSTTGSPSASASVSPSPTAVTNASPFSGRAGGAGKQVLIVKIDNTRPAQPHVGLRQADVVYIEEVEGGLTRIAAVFATTLPRVVGPIRSARITDIQLFAQYGRPAFAYSGAQHKLKPALAAAPFYDVSEDAGGRGYFRDHSRFAPYNLMGRSAQLLARAPKASTASDIGFVFSTDVPGGGRAGTTMRATWPSSSAGFVWVPSTKTYKVSLNGRPARASEGGGQYATTVVVQYVKEKNSGYGDKFGEKTPLSVTTGTGKGWVLRGGQAWPVTWSRPSLSVGTRYLGANGQPVPFGVGQVWVLLVNKKSPISVR